MGKNDSYQYNPWRAPGSAPVIDPCGQAGGKYKQTPVGGDSVFATVSLGGKTYQMGDLGSKVLPPVLQDEVTSTDSALLRRCLAPRNSSKRCHFSLSGMSRPLCGTTAPSTPSKECSLTIPCVQWCQRALPGLVTQSQESTRTTLGWPL